MVVKHMSWGAAPPLRANAVARREQAQSACIRRGPRRCFSSGFSIGASSDHSFAVIQVYALQEPATTEMKHRRVRSRLDLDGSASLQSPKSTRLGFAVDVSSLPSVVPVVPRMGIAWE